MPNIAIKKIVQVLVVFLAFVALVMVSAYVTMKAATWGRTVSVPDVSDRDLPAAINQLKQAGLGIKVDREEYHPTAPAGSVISQSPPPGVTVKKGRGISVVVSLGSQEITVPEFTGAAFRRAQVELRQSGLTLGEVARVYSSLPRETIVSQEPTAQAVVQKGSVVNLLISSGPRGYRFLVPDLTGRTVREAEAALRPFTVGVTPTGNGEVIVSQDPRPGSPVSSGGYVNVTLGKANSC